MTRTEGKELVNHPESEITAPPRFLSESELFILSSKGVLELKRDAFRAIKGISTIYQDSPSNDPSVLYKRLYPLLLSFQQKGGARFEPAGLPLPPDEIEAKRGKIEDINLHELEWHVAILYTMNLNLFARTMDVMEGREPKCRSVFGNGSYEESV